MSGDGDQWSLLIPVKRLDRAKTRLRIAAGHREDLALAMAQDTVRAALACRLVAEVVVITDDARAGHALVELGGRIVADAPDAGLNPALVHGASLALLPQVAALSSDLPALRAEELAAVLHRANQHPRSVVADASGSGTTMLTARRAVDLAPAFGVGSLAAHLAAGAVDLTIGAGASVRHDVDDLAALQVAIDLGVGPATTEALRRVDRPDPHQRRGLGHE